MTRTSDSQLLDYPANIPTSYSIIKVGRFFGLVRFLLESITPIDYAANIQFVVSK